MMIKAFDRLSVVLASLSLASVLLAASNLGVGPTIAKIIEYYHNLAHGVGALIEPTILRTLNWLGLHMRILSDNWIHVLILLKLYFLAHVSSALRDKIYPAALFYFLWGLVVALGAAISVGVISLDSNLDNALCFSIPVVAIAVFATGNTVRSATFYRRSDQSWCDAFAGPMRHVIRLLLIGVIVLVMGIIWAMQRAKQDGSYHWGLLLLFIYTIFLAFYRIIVNQAWVGGSEDKTHSVWHRIRHSRQAHIGWGMLATIIAAAIIVTLGVGENLISAK